MDPTCNVKEAVKAGKATAEIAARWFTYKERGVELPLVLVENDQKLLPPEKLLEVIDSRADKPRRRVGVARHDEIDSFVAHVNRFKTADSAVWADVGGMRLVAVLDYHPPSDTAWGEHRSIYDCPLSERWKAWTAMAGKLHLQEPLADFLDEHIEDVIGPAEGEADRYPEPIKLLELVRDLRIYQKGQFERRFDKTTGDNILVCKQETDSKSTPIPRAFKLAIPVFEGGELYGVEARLRVRIQEGRPKIGFDLHRASEIVRDAFGDIRAAVKEQTELPVFAGTPE